MLDHIVLTVRDLARSVAFYESALRPLGISHYVDYDAREGHAELNGFGHARKAYFWLKQGTPSATAIHFGFVAESQAAVQEFYAAAIAAGGRDNGPPAARHGYYAGYYAAYVLDPDGNNVEAVHKS